MADRRMKTGAAAAAALLLVAAVWAGCSIEKHYRILSFFFDGVPDPALIAAGRSELERVRAAGGTIYTHEPYEKDQCDKCHRTPDGRMMTQITAVKCLDCHAEKEDEYRFLHGPVAVRACLWCHAPHESTSKHLLRLPANELCRQCHDATLSASATRRANPAHADPDRSCLDCHSGHGSDQRFLLHAGYTSTQLPTLITPPNPPPIEAPPPRPTAVETASAEGEP
jgi:predicted CXXCH cytochrome family protein